MSHGIKKAQDEYKSSTLQQEVIDKHDADKINDTVNALIGCDAAKAREIIKKPLTLMPLVTNRRNNTSCLYAMHALMVPLMSENCSDILNEMSDADIAILKSCISAAQAYIAPDENGVKSEIARRSEEQETGKVKTGKDTTRPLKIEERKTNARMLKSLTVTQQVADSTLWPTCVAELHKWYKAIDEFKRNPLYNQASAQIKAPEHVARSADELWTLKELAEQLNKDGIERDESQIRDQIRRIKKKDDNNIDKKHILDWFNFDAKPITFKAINYEGYKTIKLRIYTTRKAKTAAPKLKLKQKEPLDMLWPIPQLAKRLGTTTKKIHNHIARCLKSKNTDLIRKINKWFVFETTPKGNKRAHAIHDAYVKPYSELFAKIRQYNRKAKPVVAKPAVVAKAPVATVEAPATEPKTLLDLRALETTATAIIKLIEIASQYEAKSAELATANKELEAAQEEMYGETDTQKIRSITGKILDAAQTRDQKEIEVATSAKAKELLEQKQSAQADKDNAEQALLAANKKFDDVLTNITTFLESLKQNSK